MATERQGAATGAIDVVGLVKPDWGGMDMTLDGERAVAWLWIAGALLFLVAAFNPSAAVFGQTSAEGRLEVLRGRSTLWTLSQLLFGAGASVTAVGVVLLGFRLLNTSAGIPLLVGGGAMMVGAALWDVHVYQRAVDPAAFAHGELAGWLFSAYTLLTLFGLVILGLAFIQVGLPAWLGYGTAAASVALAVAYLIFGDMPPFVYYVITLTGAIVLL